MGLDMYAHSIKADLTDKEVDIQYSDLFNDVDAAVLNGDINTEFAYWRKFNNLHGWMEKLYNSKGGEEEFNCTNVYLSTEDLDRLLSEVETLKPTAGFFFGANEAMTPEDISDVTDFVYRAKEEIIQGRHILYSSWW